MVFTGVEVKIRDNGLITQNKLVRNLTRRTIKIGARETWNLTQFGARMMRETHIQTSEAWKGQIRRGIKAKKLKKLTYGIQFSKQAMGLDRMRPHWVSLKRGRLITKWAEARLGKPIPRAIKVRAHPYIEEGFVKMLNRLDIVVNRIANGIVKV